MTSQAFAVGDLRFLGGHSALDFVNSVEDRASDAPSETLHDFRDVAEWAERAGFLTADEVVSVAAWSDADQASSIRALADAVAIREAMHRVLLAVASGAAPPFADVRQIQTAYASAIASASLEPSHGHLTWSWGDTQPGVERVLGPVLRAAVDLLTGSELGRVKVCASPLGCGWLFLDRSKNRSRRWCSMEGCGSQVKMRRYDAKRRLAKQAVPPS